MKVNSCYKQHPHSFFGKFQRCKESEYNCSELFIYHKSKCIDRSHISQLVSQCWNSVLVAFFHNIVCTYIPSNEGVFHLWFGEFWFQQLRLPDLPWSSVSRNADPAYGFDSFGRRTSLCCCYHFSLPCKWTTSHCNQVQNFMGFLSESKNTSFSL
jgi:hypothetical protein